MIKYLSHEMLFPDHRKVQAYAVIYSHKSVSCIMLDQCLLA